MSVSIQELELRADRAVRRGELLNALELYEALLAQSPEDERLRSRIESVRSLLQPSELVHRRKAEPTPEPQAEPMTDAEEGELHASEGRFIEAAQAYRNAVAKNPGNELLRERLLELMKLLPSDKRALDDGLASAEVLEQATPTRGQQPVDAHRSAKAADAVFRPMEAAPKSAPAHAPVVDGPGKAMPSMPPKAAPSSTGPKPAVTAKPPPAAITAKPPVAVKPPAPPPKPLPKDPVELLKVLLERVQAGRRARA
ncbi:MAG: hypothetical protein JST92_17805 [Deltaproteobacteria bacterium]|nr:hypothetical protein [Deltaproteobacteria bacterium]